MDSFSSTLADFFWPALTVFVVIFALILANIFLNRKLGEKTEKIFQKQLIMLVLTIFGAMIFIISLPISDTLRGQILGLFGILASATLALSSTTFLGNALAGILLRSVRSFEVGDFIHVQDQFGRVSGRGLFHIEIQTEDRDLTTIPNLYLATNPVKVIRLSGTIVSSEVSLGYDVPRQKAEELLIMGAKSADLQEPFVYITKLGDFSITYRVCGLLSEIKELLSTRSNLNAMILDSLHGGGIEIVSPTFMNTRAVAEKVFIPAPEQTTEQEAEGPKPEEIMFDKADMAEDLEEAIAQLQKSLDENSDAGTKEQLSLKISNLQKQQKDLVLKYEKEPPSDEGQADTD
jgi:small conductance mechanosensitive channel